MRERFLIHSRRHKTLASWRAVALAAALATCLAACAPLQVSQAPTANVDTGAAATTSVAVHADGSLPVPSNLVPLTQPAGQQRLLSTADNQSYWPLSQYFETQKNEAYCSVATSVMVLNALNIPRPKTALYPGFPYFTQDDFFHSVDPQLADPLRVSHEGMTLDQLGAVLGHFAVSVHPFHASDLTLEQFRDLVRDTTGRRDRFALLNFHRTQIGEAGGGHWSPLAAFDPASDSALLLDVARYKYPAVWVPVTQLYQAALAVDSVSGLARGIVVVSRP
ncbi:phytochelatin synthase family protein [Paraburkholderia megapolitana]|uniref:glutathione gamma-glutamylcysteinyltransferase n=1 Tax=Paraburkholderia megapolitana TaxID=420953 RepID=A0A1I3D7W6_9BURK|nr:phytochelatin synthase family protein [Paraburkholderia megapolitana]QDQ81717.1 phytochelatin synthase [Paraburkholderia megapolitana]SFH82824.1 Phytochelatin synthase [Paraburkholderia megapolitana]